MKLTFDEALERLNEERSIDRDNVRADALYRKVWVCEWHIPGCLSESRSLCLTKKEAVEQGVEFTGGKDDFINHYPRGIKTALQKFGNFQHHTEMFGNVVTTIERMQLVDLL